MLLLRVAGISAALIFAAPAFAHTGEGTGGFLAGLAHPVFGLDHVVAMVAVGLWGAFLGAPAIWLLPIVFPLVMAAGGGLGIIGVGRAAIARGPAAAGRAGARLRGVGGRLGGRGGGAPAALGRRRAGRHVRDLP